MGRAEGEELPEDWVRIATFRTPVEAHLARMHLESEGITSFILDEHMATTSVWGAVAGVRLMVSQSDAARAADILRQRREGL